MEKKTIQKQTVIQHTMTTCFATFHQDLGELPCQIEAKIAELGLDIQGPHIWEYVGASMSPDQPFKLRITIPVKEAKGNPAPFQFADLEEITCVVTEHKGSWDTLGQTYEKFFPQIYQSGLQPTTICREIYHLCDFETPANCVTEIQVGVN